MLSEAKSRPSAPACARVKLGTDEHFDEVDRALFDTRPRVAHLYVFKMNKKEKNV